MKKQTIYFLTQRLIGLALIGLSVLLICIGVGEPLILTVPLGLTALFSKEKVYVDDTHFFEETKDERL